MVNNNLVRYIQEYLIKNFILTIFVWIIYRTIKMKAPLSNRIKNILADRESSYKLMRTVLSGKRDGDSVMEIDGKSITLERVGVRKIDR